MIQVQQEIKVYLTVPTGREMESEVQPSFTVSSREAVSWRSAMSLIEAHDSLQQQTRIVLGIWVGVTKAVVMGRALA